jgi:hypothetical protein
MAIFDNVVAILNSILSIMFIIFDDNYVYCMGGVVVRALTSHHCDPGLIPGLSVVCELSLLLILSLASRVFLWVLRFSKNQHS